MEKKLNLSIILPIKSTLAKDFDTYFDRAIKSIQIQHTKPSEVVIVHSDEDGLRNVSYLLNELNKNIKE